MVKFETEVYEKSGEDIVGVKVIVSADNGQVIDEIQVTNKMEFDELVSKLNVLGDTYVQFSEDSNLKGSTIDEILSNSENMVVTYSNGTTETFKILKWLFRGEKNVIR